MYPLNNRQFLLIRHIAIRTSDTCIESRNISREDYNLCDSLYDLPCSLELLSLEESARVHLYFLNIFVELVRNCNATIKGRNICLSIQLGNFQPHLHL